MREKRANALEPPQYREWIFDEDFATSREPMPEFRLIYQGLLLSDREGSSGRSQHKNEIRRYFHPQLANVWKTKYPLRYRADPHYWHGSNPATDAREGTGLDRLGTNFRIGDKKILPIVTHEDSLVCALDILILRRDFRVVVDSGDLDNRIKTLLDAMRIPKANEDSSGPENPLCCVMEDDRLISELKVVADYLFADPEQIVHSPKVSPVTGEQTIKENHALVVINVSVKAIKATGYTEFM